MKVTANSEEHSIPQTRATGHWLLILLVLAFIFRAAFGMGLQSFLDQRNRSFLIEGDANGYWQLTHSLVENGEFSAHNPPRRVLRMPGFPALLMLSGGNLLAARILLAAIGTLACWLVYLVGCELTDRRTALFATTLAVFSPMFVAFSGLILSETTFAAGMLLSLHSGIRFFRSLQNEGANLKTLAIRASLTGFLIALACYIRPSWLLVAPILTFILPFFAKKTDRLKSLGMGCLLLFSTFLTLLPWAVRNQQVTGHWVFTTLWAGPSLYDGLNPHATGESDMSFFEKDNLLEQMSEYEMNRHYNQRAWNFARENPRAVIRLAFVKLLRFWKPWPNAQQFRNPWFIAGCFAWFLVIYIPAAIGIYHARKSPLLLLATLGPVLYFSAIHSIFVGSIRYRIPAEYPLVILSAVGWKAIHRSILKWRNSAAKFA
ncbi:MAG: hypothetical protein Tsb009_18070 [Planctomycetaceae bacterium]